MMILVDNLDRKAAGLAVTASAPGCAAATAAAATTAASAASATATASAAAAATPGYLHAILGSSRVFLVEHIERRQADVGDFFLTERECLTRRHVQRLWRVRYRSDRCGCTPDQRKSQTSCPQHRDGFRRTLFLRSQFHSWHSRFLHTCKKCFESSKAILRWANAPCKALQAHQIPEILVHKRFMFMNGAGAVHRHQIMCRNRNRVGSIQNG
jgi:hypothetical protein